MALLAFGSYSIINLPRESNPEVQIPVAVVTTVFPGSTAEDVEKLITNKIEEDLNNNLDELNKLTSTSKSGVSSVVAEFNADADIEASIQKVKDEIDKVKPDLPQDAEDPIVSDVNFVDQPIMIVSVSSDLPVTEFITLSDQIEDELKSVKGVSKISKSGIPEKETQVIVNKEQLHNFGLNITDVLRAIAQANSAVPVGSIEMDGVEYNVKFEGDIKDPSQIRDLAILNSQGKTIYVRDLAFVSDGVSHPLTYSRISVNSEPSQQAVSFAVFKKRGGDVTRIASDVRDKVEDLKGGLLKDSQTLVSFDSGKYVERDLSNLTNTGVQTIILVMLLLFLAIGWRESIISGLAIPLSFLVAFIGLFASGNSINFVSLFSLILAVGVLVDSAIVMTEGIHTNILRGLSKKESAIKTIKEFNWPLISGTMTTVAVFAPLFFISGTTGQFIKIIPFTIIFVLLASLFVALGIIPLITTIFLKKKNGYESNFQKKQEDYTKKIQGWYKNILEKFLGDRKKENRFFLAMIIGLILALSLPITGLVKTTFFEQEDADFLAVEVEKPEGTTLEQTDLSVREVEEMLYGEPDVESFVTTVGRTSSFSNESVAGEKYGNITVILKDDRERTSTEVLNSISDKVKSIRSATVSVSEPNNGPPQGAPVLVKFFGDNLDDLEKAVLVGEEALKNIDGTIYVKNSMRNNGSEFVIKVNEAKASEFGINSSQIAQILRTAIHGSTATTIKSQGEDIDVIVKLNLNSNYTDPHDTNNTNIEAIKQTEIQTQKGPILLGSIVDVSLERSNSAISHEDRQRIATASSQLKEGYTATEITAQFKEKIKDYKLPEGVSFKIGGESEDVDQSFKDMFVALIAGMVLVLSILVLQFNSFKQAFFIIAIVPLSLIGIFLGLLITKSTLSFPSIMGYIALSGIVVNNSIILIDVINSLRKQNPEENLKELIIRGAVSRLRPIILTTVTTIIGIFPLTYVAALWSPLAFAIIFGLAFAVLITLLLVPILYNRWPGKIKTE